jgi:hypothetical protein
VPYARALLGGFARRIFGLDLPREILPAGTMRGFPRRLRETAQLADGDPGLTRPRLTFPARVRQHWALFGDVAEWLKAAVC